MGKCVAPSRPHVWLSAFVFILVWTVIRFIRCIQLQIRILNITTGWKCKCKCMNLFPQIHMLLTVVMIFYYNLILLFVSRWIFELLPCFSYFNKKKKDQFTYRTVRCLRLGIPVKPCIVRFLLPVSLQQQCCWIPLRKETESSFFLGSIRRYQQN